VKHIAIGLLLILALASQAFAQASLSVFGVDATSFPVIKAKFYAFDAAGQQVSPSASEISVTEDGTPRTVLSVSCPPAEPAKALSSVLVMDVSGSMSSDAGGTSRIAIAKAVATEWVNGLPLGASECALSSFDDQNYLNQDFTTNRAKLLNAISELKPQGSGTDYNAGLLLPVAGGLQVSKSGKHQKVIVFLSDGISSTFTQGISIITEAQSQNCIIYCITIGMKCPNTLKAIASQTGGLWFEGINSWEQAEKVYFQILNHCKSASIPCEISWQSDVSCKDSDRMVEFSWEALNSKVSFKPPQIAVAHLEVDPYLLFILSKPIGIRFDTTVTIKAVNSAFKTTDIISTNTAFDISPKSFSLNAGESKSLTVSYTPVDSNYNWTEFDIQTSLCKQKYFAGASYPEKKPLVPSLKLSRPNGGETFVVGCDTLITWSGMPITDTVRLEYTTDNGITWDIIADKATGGYFVWHIPHTLSALCRVRVVQLFNIKMKDWLSGHGGNSFDYGHAIAVDPSGNVYVTGYFNGTADFNGRVLQSVGLGDVFVVKYKPDGEVEWAMRAGGSVDDAGNSIAVDALGNVFVCGTFMRSADFGVDTLTSSHKLFSDVFIMKIRSNGNVEWVKKAWVGQNNNINGIAIDPFENIYVTGSFIDSVDFEGIKLTSNGGSDIFLTKYRLDGNIDWAINVGGTYYLDDGLSVATDMLGNVFITGSFALTADFGGIKLTSPTNSTSVFIAKYMKDGSLDWARSGGAQNSYAQGQSITVDASGNSFITGFFSNMADFGPKSITSTGSNDIFIAKYFPDGSLDWVRSAGGDSAYDKGYSIAVDLSGNSYIIGSFSDTIHFGNNILFSKSINIFLTKYDSTGNIAWAKQAGGITGDDVGFGVAIDALASIYSTGYFENVASFGASQLVSTGQDDIFVWKIVDNELQSDTSDSVFSIVIPQAASTDIDMGKALVGKAKDSVVTTFIRNTGSYPFRVDSIWFAGAQPGDFSLVSGIPPFDVPAGTAQQVEFRFMPTAAGLRTADIFIMTQADTLRQKIQGEGIIPVISTIGSTIDLGLVNIGSFKDTTINVAIQNTGNVSVNFTGDAELGPDKTQFSVIAGGGAFSLNPGESRTVTLRFTPQFIGRASARIGFDYAAAGSPAILYLFGQGIGGSVYVPDDSGSPGETRRIAVMLSGPRKYIKDDNVTKFSCDLSFNESLLTPVDMQQRGMIAGGVQTMHIAGAWDGASDTLAVIPMTVGLGDATTSSVDIPTFRWLDDFGAEVPLDIDTRSGVFTLTGLCTQGGTRLFSATGKFSLSQNHPNPASGITEIEYETIEDGRTTLYVADILGRRVANIADADAKAGKYSVRFDASNLANGKYFYILQTPTQRLIKAMDVSK
jgi:sugar lactone lactonase YvrE